MKFSRFLVPLAVLAISAVAYAQTPAAQPAPAVSYASVSEVNSVLTQIDQMTQTLSADLGKLRIERWKTDNDYKRQNQTHSDSLLRNLQGAMPGMVAQLRSAPESLSATFKLYRNVGALYDVLSSLTESAGAFGSKDEFQMLANDSSALEQSRRALADRMEKLSSAKEGELADLRNQVKILQAAIPAAPPKKIIIDEDEKPKKPVKKKPANPKPAATTPATTAPKPQ
jgi:TolA-binding protein